MKGKKNIEKENEILENKETKETKEKVYSSDNAFENKEIANKQFEKSIEKLFDVNEWTNLPGISSTFQLYNNLAEKIYRNKVNKGDYIKIILPGPFPENWVFVTDIKQSKKSAEFTVSPSKEPLGNSNEIKHFFIKEAKSNFKVELKNNKIYAFEIGMNEGINNSGKESGNRELINTLIAEGGWAGFQKFQWKKLTEYLVHKTEVDK